MAVLKCPCLTFSAGMSCLDTKISLVPTIPDKTTSESFPHHVYFPTQQIYFQNDILQKENPFPQFNVASYKSPGIRLSFEYTTTLPSGEGGEGRTATATMFTKMLSKYTIFSTVLSKIVASIHSTFNLIGPCNTPSEQTKATKPHSHKDTYA